MPALEDLLACNHIFASRFLCHHTRSTLVNVFCRYVESHMHLTQYPYLSPTLPPDPRLVIHKHPTNAITTHASLEASWACNSAGATVFVFNADTTSKGYFVLALCKYTLSTPMPTLTQTHCPMMIPQPLWPPYA